MPICHLDFVHLQTFLKVEKALCYYQFSAYSLPL